MPVNPHVIIVGLGLAGLSAARTLSGRGLDILLMDENARPGGAIPAPGAPPFRGRFAPRPGTP